MSTTSTLGGALIRSGPDCWAWSDGTPEPRVSDLRWSVVTNFRIRTESSASFVEVPRGFATETAELKWIIEGARAGRYRSGPSGDHAGPVDIGTGKRLHVPPGSDPLRGHEPMTLPGPIPAVLLAGEVHEQVRGLVKEPRPMPDERTPAATAGLSGSPGRSSCRQVQVRAIPG